MKQFGIAQGLRATVQRYQHFFNNKDRLRRFKELAISPYTKNKIELSMMNVICRTRALDFETVLRTVLMDTLHDEDNRFLHDLSSHFD